MLNILLADFYERDFRQLIEEINLFKNEADVWKTQGEIKNSAGHLVLHLIGGMNYLIGTNLAGTGYIRNRDLEFSAKPVSRSELISGVEALISLVTRTLQELEPKQMEAEYPTFFDKSGTTISYVLIQLLAHLNYHLGQINYLRRQLA
jgi:hypothetical protein